MNNYTSSSSQYTSGVYTIRKNLLKLITARLHTRRASCAIWRNDNFVAITIWHLTKMRAKS